MLTQTVTRMLQGSNLFSTWQQPRLPHRMRQIKIHCAPMRTRGVCGGAGGTTGDFLGFGLYIGIR